MVKIVLVNVGRDDFCNYTMVFNVTYILILNFPNRLFVKRNVWTHHFLVLHIWSVPVFFCGVGGEWNISLFTNIPHNYHSVPKNPHIKQLSKMCTTNGARKYETISLLAI